MNRKPCVAGQFYASDFNKLDKQIIDCFKSKFGPGTLPVRKRKGKVFGAIAPHAGYMFSGHAQAWVYKEIAEAEFPDLFVIIGPNHTGFGANFSTYLFSDWETPLGTVKVDKKFGKELIKKFPSLVNETGAHLSEHSIEVQLPFLQFANRDKLKDIKFLPIIVGYSEYNECLKLADAITDTDKNICVIASSDFTHYGPNYGYLPFVHAKKENIYNLDSEAINFVKKLDSKGFFEYKNKRKATICGAGPIIVAIEAVKSLGAKSGKLLSYYTSADITNKDYTNAVGYAAIVFKK